MSIVSGAVILSGRSVW